MRHHVQAAGLADVVTVDSAGTMAYHDGDEPDPRAQMAAEKRGYQLFDLRARPLLQEDYQIFDLILAMDSSHLRVMRQMSGVAGSAELKLMLDYATGQNGRDVPDPYYGETGDFETVLDLIEMGVRGLMIDIHDRLKRG